MANSQDDKSGIDALIPDLRNSKYDIWDIGLFLTGAVLMGMGTSLGAWLLKIIMRDYVQPIAGIKPLPETTTPTNA